MSRTGHRQIRRRQRMERGINSSKAGRFAAEVLEGLLPQPISNPEGIVFDDIAMDGPMAPVRDPEGSQQAHDNYMRYEAPRDLEDELWGNEEDES